MSSRYSHVVQQSTGVAASATLCNRVKNTSLCSRRLPPSYIAYTDFQRVFTWHRHCDRAQWSRSRRGFLRPRGGSSSTVDLLMGVVPWRDADSSLVCIVPFGVDALVIVLASKYGGIFWIFPPLVTAGSLVGAALTYWVGHSAGGAGLTR